MVGRSRQGADAVDTSWQASSDGGLQVTLSIARIIDTLEKCKSLCIERCSGVESSTHILKGDMHVADDLSIVADGLRRSVVLGRWVDEDTGSQTRNGECNIEVRVGGDVDASLRVRDDGRNHLILCRDITHGNSVTGARDVLLTIGDGLAGAEVDEVEWVAGRNC